MAPRDSGKRIARPRRGPGFEEPCHPWEVDAGAVKASGPSALPEKLPISILDACRRLSTELGGSLRGSLRRYPIEGRALLELKERFDSAQVRLTHLPIAGDIEATFQSRNPGEQLASQGRVAAYYQVSV